ncbi:MAG TPA: glycosyltransferase family 9 protein [Gemmatimonadaceae bacterium]|nr:glycosyltransferase family 9 protein [Gemmatimonadaceae bacterium]
MAHPALKRLEKAGQSLLFAAARGLVPRGERGLLPDWDARAHRVLYLRYDRIGDMIMATGLLRAIAGSHPGIQLDVLASPANAPVLEGNPHVRRVLRFDRRRARQLPGVLRMLRDGRYDAVIDGMVMSPSVTMMLLMIGSGAPHRIGIGGRRNDFVYTLPVPPAPADAHFIDQSRQAAIPFGVDLERTNWKPELFLRPAEAYLAESQWASAGAATRLLVNISASAENRRWPTGNFVAVIREARRLDPSARVLVMSSPNDQEEAANIAVQADAELAHAPSIRAAFALVATATAVFTPDTSISHACAALDVPVAVMMLPTRSQYGPYAARHVCLESDGSTLLELPLDRALAGLGTLLELARA